jgi:hypothetical protein
MGWFQTLMTHAGAGGAPVVQPIRTVVTENRPYNGKGTGDVVGNNRTHLRADWGYSIGSGSVTEILSWDSAWFHSTGGTGYNDLGNAYTIVKRSFQCNGIIVGVTWAGLRSIVIENGDDEIACDPIPASAFGLAEFTADTELWEHSEYSVETIGLALPNSAAQIGDRTTRNKVIWFNPEVTTVSDVDVGGLSSVTGTAAYARTVGPRPLIVGRPKNDATFKTDLNMSDSIGSGQGDATARKHGRGWFQICHVDADGVSNPIANLNMAIGGDNALNQSNSPKYLKKARLCKSTFFESNGTNSLGVSGSGDPVLACGYSALLWNNWRTYNPTAPIIRGYMIPRTDATNTPLTNYGVGQKSYAMNEAFKADLANGVIQYLIDPVGVRLDETYNSTGYYQWLNPVSDYTHPNNAQHIIIADVQRPAMAVIPP